MNEAKRKTKLDPRIWIGAVIIGLVFVGSLLWWATRPAVPIQQPPAIEAPPADDPQLPVDESE